MDVSWKNHFSRKNRSIFLQICYNHSSYYHIFCICFFIFLLLILLLISMFNWWFLWNIRHSWLLAKSI